MQEPQHFTLFKRGYTAHFRLPAPESASTFFVCQAAFHEGDVLVKCIDRAGTSDDTIQSEVEAIRRASACPYIVSLMDVFSDDTHTYLVMPYAEGGDLFTQVHGFDTGMTEPVCRRLFVHIVRALLYLKSIGIAHGDVSLENIVLQTHHRQDWNTTVNSSDSPYEWALQTCTAQLVDFGAARYFREKSPYRYRGKLTYVPVEVVTGTDADVDLQVVDVWQLGVCLFAMLSGRLFYTGPSDVGFEWLRQGRISELLECYHASLGSQLPKGAHELLCAMLRPQPRDRITLEEIMNNAWVRSIDSSPTQG